MEFVSSSELVVPEYKINLLNKNKKIVKIVENLNKIEGLLVEIKSKPSKKSEDKIAKSSETKKTKKTALKKKKKLRTLWVRRRK